MPVLPLVGSTIEVSGLMRPGPLRRLDHGHADAVFDAPQGVLKFQFGQDDGRQSPGDGVQPDQGRGAHGVHDIGKDFSHDLSSLSRINFPRP